MASMWDAFMEQVRTMPSPVEGARAAAGARSPVESTEGRVYRSDLPREQALLKERLRARNEAILAAGTAAGPQSYQRLREINLRPASPFTPAVGQRERDERLRAQVAAAQAPKKTTEQVDPTTGDYTRKEEMETDDGKVTRERKGNKYQEQYEKLLQQQVNQQQMLRLQPLAQLVDQLTGSRLAPGFQDPNIAARQDLAARVQAAGQLAQMEAAPAAAEYKRFICLERKAEIGTG